MVKAVHRPTQVIVDRAAIRNNVRLEKEKLTNGEVLFAVVKANGYGHGAIEVAQAAVAAGADGFCVALLDEALELREAGLKLPILILGITAVEDAVLMARENISATVSSLAWLEAADQLLAAAQEVSPLHIHLALDTGMGRIGFTNPRDLMAAVAYLKTAPHLDFEGIFTHFATADEADETYFNQQKNKFDALMAVVTERPRYVHVTNSATSIWHQSCSGNLIRAGIILYGLNPSGHALPIPDTYQPALSLTTELTHVKELRQGDSVSYGKTYTAEQDEWVGTLPIGYADGWLRGLQGFKVLVEGHYCEIIGRVCMDQCMIRLPKEFAVGSKVTLIGEDNGAVVSLQDIADKLNTIHYEVICNLGSRLNRVYLN